MGKVRLYTKNCLQCFKFYRSLQHRVVSLPRPFCNSSTCVHQRALCCHRRVHSVCVLLPKFGRGRICVRHVPVHASARLPRPHYYYSDYLQWPASSAAGCFPIKVSEDWPIVFWESFNCTACTCTLLDAAIQTFLGCPLPFRPSTSIRAAKTIIYSCRSFAPRSAVCFAHESHGVVRGWNLNRFLCCWVTVECTHIWMQIAMSIGVINLFSHHPGNRTHPGHSASGCGHVACAPWSLCVLPTGISLAIVCLQTTQQVTQPIAVFVYRVYLRIVTSSRGHSRFFRSDRPSCRSNKTAWDEFPFFVCVFFH